MGTFGNKLKALRLERGKIQKEVALELELSETGYSAYENDLRMPGLKTLIKIADYYNVSIDYLLGRDDKIYIDYQVMKKHIHELKKAIKEMEDYVDRFE